MMKTIKNHKALFASSVILTVGFAYAYSQITMQDILMTLPESIRYIMLESSIKNEMIIEANIHENSLWVIYKLEPNKLGQIKDRIPKHLQLIPHKIYATDNEANYYLLYNIYLSGLDTGPASTYSIRLEINVICYNPATKNNCFVIIDYYTDNMRFDPANPFGRPNCIKLSDQDGFNVDGDTLKCGIKSNQDSNDILFKYQGKIKSGNIVEPDDGFLYANKEFYFGSTDTELLEKYGFTMFGEFDAKEHNNYTEIERIQNVNNLFGDAIQEFVTSFVIPNRQYYKIKMTSTRSSI